MAAQTGKVSWFGGPNDPSTGNSTALGVSLATNPGIAVYDKSTLGGYWLVKLGNTVKVVRQTDYGPAPWTGKTFDFSYNLLKEFGFNESSFPTGGQATGAYLGKNATDLSHNLGAAFSQVGATPADLGNIAPNPSVAQAQQIIDGVNSQGAVGAKISGANTNPGQVAANVANAIGGAVDSAGRIADLVTSTAFWIRLAEVIAGILLVAMGLRSLTGSTTTPLSVAATAAKAVR